MDEYRIPAKLGGAPLYQVIVGPDGEETVHIVECEQCPSLKVCGNCEHWDYTEIEYCVAQPKYALGLEPCRRGDHCHFNPPLWELCK